MVAPKPPANYWGHLIALGSLIVSILSLLNANSKSDREDVRKQEQRLCRLEAQAHAGDCK